MDVDEIEVALSSSAPAKGADEIGSLDLPLKAAREKFERGYLEHQLRLAGGNVSQVATRAGLERTHLYRKLKSLGIDPKAVVSGED